MRLEEAATRYAVDDRTLDAEWQVGAHPTAPQSGVRSGREFELRDDGSLGVAAGWDLRIGEGRGLVR